MPHLECRDFRGAVGVQGTDCDHAYFGNKEEVDGERVTN